MIQIINTNQVILEIEHRRPGLWIVANDTRLFAIEIGQDRITFDIYFRVTWGAGRFAHFPQIQTAIEFCRSFAGAAR